MKDFLRKRWTISLAPLHHFLSEKKKKKFLSFSSSFDGRTSDSFVKVEPWVQEYRVRPGGTVHLDEASHVGSGVGRTLSLWRTTIGDEKDVKSSVAHEDTADVKDSCGTRFFRV